MHTGYWEAAGFDSPECKRLVHTVAVHCLKKEKVRGDEEVISPADSEYTPVHILLCSSSAYDINLFSSLRSSGLL